MKAEKKEYSRTKSSQYLVGHYRQDIQSLNWVSLAEHPFCEIDMQSYVIKYC